MLHRVGAHVRFCWDYVQANFLIALEYRATFVSQIVGMLINDLMWVTFWWIYFTSFRVLGGGWTLGDVMTMWAITAVGLGLSVGLFGNQVRLAQIISQGELDYYLGLPKNVLLHVLVSRMDLTGWGDVVFGLGLYMVVLQPDAAHLALFVGLALCGSVLILAFNIFWQSLAFWLGQSEGLAFQMWNALIMFSTYPAPLFSGGVKLLLFTVVPAGLISHVPVELLRHFDPVWLLGEIAFALAALLLALLVFYRGLRRYESGNLLILRA